VLTKSYPQLNLAVLKQRKDKPLRLWLIARAIRPYGVITERELWQIIKREQLFTKRTMLSALKAGDNIFWDRVRGTIYYKGVLRVADALDVNLSYHPVWIDIPAGLGDFRRLLVEAFFANKPKTIALATVASLTGRTKQTAIKYLRGCDKTVNLMISHRSPQDHVIPELAAQGYYRTVINGQNVLVKRMANTYSSDHETAAYGQVKEQQCLSQTNCKPMALYFTNVKTARRAIVDERTIYTPIGHDRQRVTWRGQTRVIIENVITVM